MSDTPYAPVHVTHVRPWPGSRNAATGEPLFDWSCNCGAGDCGLDSRSDAEREAARHVRSKR